MFLLNLGDCRKRIAADVRGFGWVPQRSNNRLQRTADKLATSSVQVVRDEPGFLGFISAGPANNTDRDFVFASMWCDVDAIKARFGRNWGVSFLPPGYAELIEECSVEHYKLTEQFFPR